MSRKKVDTQHTRYVLRIVCEGDKTEPLFFTELCNDFLKDDDMDVKTIPQPVIPEDERERSVSAERGSHERKTRRTNDNPVPNDIVFGQPPLKWVQKARECIKEGANEVWAVYDKDEHPKHKEAFDEAERIIDGKKVNIAFSSRSFEYYLLLHFEYLYKAFEETECCSKLPKKEGRNCCGRDIPEFDKIDCKGEKCINGYARIHKYWEESKKTISTYQRVKNYLIKGMVNACRLRLESNSVTDSPIYERNPYTNADKLVGRIIKCTTVAFGDSSCDNNLSVRLDDDGLHIKNISDKDVMFNPEAFKYYNWENNQTDIFDAPRKILCPDEEIVIACNPDSKQVIKWKSDSWTDVLLLSKY